MKEEKKLKIEEYIKDWFWDDDSHKFAFELGTYLFDFMEDLEEHSELSESTIRKHFGNCWSIGILICQYGYHEIFSPKIFTYPPYHEMEFRRKHIASKYQVASYNSTCKRIEKYALKKGDLSYKTE